MVSSGRDAKVILEMVFAGLPTATYDSNEIKEMIIEGQAEVCCHFCSKKYSFSAHELADVLHEIESNHEK